MGTAPRGLTKEPQVSDLVDLGGFEPSKQCAALLAGVKPQVRDLTASTEAPGREHR